MSALYLELVERIRGEIPDLDRLAQRALAAWAQAKRLPGESAYLDSVALNLHGAQCVYHEPGAGKDGWPDVGLADTVACAAR
mgnify:CR=1 FL=1